MKAFGLDYLVILGYLAALAAVGSLLTYGPLADGWSALLSRPWRVDLLAFLVAVLPVTLYFAISEASAAGGTWGKRCTGIRVVGAEGGRLVFARSLARSALKFLPWQMAHTAMLHIPGFPMAPQQPPVWTMVVLSAVWLLVGVYLVGLTPLAGGRTLYDRIAGSTVMETRAATEPGTARAS